MKLFGSFNEWWEYLLAAIVKVFVGLARILLAIVSGIASVVAYVYNRIKRFFHNWFRRFVAVTVILVLVVISWVVTFVNERAMRVSAEMQRDSISYVLSSKGCK